MRETSSECSTDSRRGILLSAAIESEPKRAWRNLGEAVECEQGNEYVSIYALDLSVGVYNLKYSSMDISPTSFSIGEDGDLIDLLGEQHSHTQKNDFRLGQNLVGYIFVSGSDPKFRSTYGYIATNIYIRERNFSLYSNLNKPVDFEVNYGEFISSLTDVASKSCRMEFGAYRIPRRDKLEAIFSWGFPASEVGENHQNLTVSVGENEKLDRALMLGETQVCYDLADDFPKFVADHPLQRDVRSFLAVPVKVGHSIEGVLSLATSVSYRFSDIEREAFLCIANGIGVALSNFQLYRDGKTKGVEFERISSSIVGVEVAQSIRHDILLNAGNIGNSISQVESRIRKDERISQSSKEGYFTLLGIASKESEKISRSISKLKNVMKVDRVVRISDVSDLWRDSVSHVSFRLRDLSITVSQPGRKQHVPLLSDLVKHIFHNLILNSMDAFLGSSRHKREIDLRIESFDTRMRIIRMTYSDTGPGLDQYSIEKKFESEGLDSDIDARLQGSKRTSEASEIIFEKGFTTKKTGSGYGLFLARRMARYHGGGIVHRTPSSGRGAIFDIEISYDLRKIEKESLEPIYEENEKGEIVPIDIMEYLKRHKL